MKKVIGVIGMVLLICSSYAQSDLFSSIEKLGSELKYKGFYATGNDDEGYSFTESTAMFSMEMTKNRFGRNVGFKRVYADKEDEYSGERMKTDNYILPAYMYNSSHGWSYRSYIVMIDSVVYELVKFNDEDYTFEIEKLWIPIVNNEKEKTKPASGKKKLNMKQRIAEAKAFLEGGNYGSLYSKQEEVRHHEKVVSYLKSMKALQEKNPYSAAVKEELAALKADKDRESAEIKAANDAYWTSAEGQRQLAKMNGNKGGSNEVTIVNTGSKYLRITHSGGSFTINPGSKRKEFCNKDIYFAVYNESSKIYNGKGAMLYKANSSCGGTIEVEGKSN